MTPWLLLKSRFVFLPAVLLSMAAVHAETVLLEDDFSGYGVGALGMLGDWPGEAPGAVAGLRWQTAPNGGLQEIFAGEIGGRDGYFYGFYEVQEGALTTHSQLVFPAAYAGVGGWQLELDFFIESLDEPGVFSLVGLFDSAVRSDDRVVSVSLSRTTGSGNIRASVQRAGGSSFFPQSLEAGQWYSLVLEGDNATGEIDISLSGGGVEQSMAGLGYATDARRFRVIAIGDTIANHWAPGRRNKVFMDTIKLSHGDNEPFPQTEAVKGGEPETWREWVEQRHDWRQLIGGENLAAGLEARLLPVPKHRRSTSGTEPFKLTDGVWRDGVFLPSSPDTAVGWTYVSGPITIFLDLGEVRDIGYLVARVLGGGSFVSGVFPRRMDVLLSEDGQQYYRAAALSRVSGGESELALQQPETYFHLSEEGSGYVYPFVFDVHHRARYLAFEVTTVSGALFMDQLFVIGTDDTAAVRSLEGLEKVSMLTQGVQVRPKWPELTITTNVITPNYFYVSDVRTEEEKADVPAVIFDLPNGVDLKMGRRGSARRDGAAVDQNRWIVEGLWDSENLDWMGMEGPVFFIPREGVELPPDAVAVISVDRADSAGNTLEVPIQWLEIPEVEPLDAFHISLTWMLEEHSYTYPDFFNAFRHLGFNALGFFPRNHDPNWRPHRTVEDQRRLADFTRAARDAGFGIIYNESPFHVMEQLWAEQDEMFTLVNGKRGNHLSPSYHGTYYHKEMDRVRESAKLIEPDVVFFDIELWYRSAREWHDCERTQAAFRESGIQDWDQFLIAQGTRMIRDLHAAIEGTGPDGSTPIAGSYNVVATPPVYHEVFEFSRLYPQYLQFGMPVLYVRGNMQTVNEVTRRNYLAMGTRDQIPWITAGTYGEFPPHRIAQQIFELALNGARGGTYYRFQDNDPLDYYYQAVALKALSPHQDLLIHGGMLELVDDGGSLTLSAWGTDGEALLLFGNYDVNAAEKSIIPAVAGRTIQRLTDAMDGQSLNPGDSIWVAPDGQRLLHAVFHPE